MFPYLQVPEEEVDFQKRGPGAYEALASGKVPTTFRGLPVYQSYPLDVDFNGRPISLLDRDREIGEWTYVMPGEDIWMYDANVDRFVKISYETAKSYIINDGQEMSHPDDDPKTASKAIVAKAKPPAASTTSAASVTSSSGKRSGKSKPPAPAPVESSSSSSSSSADGPILIFRPFQTWTMSSAILCRAGSELGNTWHGHHDMQLQNDAIRKVMVGHYTFYSRAIVKQPKMVSVVEDVFTQGYVSGEGTSFFEDASKFQEAWRAQDIGTKKCRKSLIAWMIHPRYTRQDIDKLPDALDLLGEFPNTQQNYISGQSDVIPNQQELEKTLQISTLRPMRQEEGNLFLRAHSPLNTVCFRAKRYARQRIDLGERPVDLKARLTHNNTGHWGKDVYPGCFAHRSGMGGNGFLVEQTETVSLE